MVLGVRQHKGQHVAQEGKALGAENRLLPLKGAQVIIAGDPFAGEDIVHTGHGPGLV